MVHPHASRGVHGGGQEHSSTTPFSLMFLVLGYKKKDEFDKNIIALAKHQILVFLFVLEFTRSFDLGRSDSR
jgi:hypothetical protein